MSVSRPESARIHGVLILVQVFIVGWAVLAVEMLGTRILGPYYGVSLFLWSALITVTLAALAAGYWIGGRWADRNQSFSNLCLQMAIPGVWLLLVPWIKGPALDLAGMLGLRSAVLLSALLLFGPPLVMLGAVSPYAVRLRVSRMDSVGRAAGSLYAVSTLGGVFSALINGFILIPSIGISRLTAFTGILLLAGAFPGWMFHAGRSMKNKAGMPLLFLAAAVWGVWTGGAESRSSSDVFIGRSLYGEIRVTDLDSVRYLFIDGAVHSAADASTGRPVLPVVSVLDIPGYFFEKAGGMLVIGLGAGSVVSRYHDSGWKIDAVDVDPAVIETAGRFFGLESSMAQVFCEDGRRFLRSHTDPYDLIIIDAFGSTLPFHLVSAEAFGLAASRLKQGGILAMNLESIGWTDRLVLSIAAGLKLHFGNVLALPMAEPPDQFGNVILLASDRVLDLPFELPPVLDRFGPQYPINNAWDNRLSPDTRHARIQTDDSNPVDLWSESINLESRKSLRSLFGEAYPY